MTAQRREGTAPELALRSALHRLGLRYRLHVAPLASVRRKADIVFNRQQVAIFVDGCFWHGCPDHGRRQHAVNGWYWPNKIAGNQRRDEDTGHLLALSGWRSVRFWEHELLTAADATACALRVKVLVEQHPGPSQAKKGPAPARRGSSSVSPARTGQAGTSPRERSKPAGR